MMYAAKAYLSNTVMKEGCKDLKLEIGFPETIGDAVI